LSLGENNFMRHFCEIFKLGRLGVGLTVLVLAFPTFAAGKAEAGKAKATVCAACHGKEGKPAGGAFPALAGQHGDYLLRQLRNFKSGARQNQIMQGQVASLSDQDMQNLAAYFSSLSPREGSASNADLVKQGERIYRGGNGKTGVAPCSGCHEPNGAGIPARFPRVSGQLAAYTEQQLKTFKDGTRKSDGNIMNDIAGRMTDAEIKAAAEYMSGLR
jgi:cytochrome c553